MKLHELVRSKGLKDKARRKGRWNGSKGNTSGRGNNGQKSRAWSSISPSFEWGQTPLVKRIPKLRGFKRYYKLLDNYAVVNVGDLEKDKRVEKEVSKENLQARGYAKAKDKVKILGNGDLEKKLVFKNIEKYSKSAIEKIEKAGGSVEAMEEKKKPSKKEYKKEDKKEDK